MERTGSGQRLPPSPKDDEPTPKLPNTDSNTQNNISTHRYAHLTKTMRNYDCLRTPGATPKNIYRASGCDLRKNNTAAMKTRKIGLAL